MTPDEKRFLEMVHDPELRPILLDRLHHMGLLDEFLEVEDDETT